VSSSASRGRKKPAKPAAPHPRSRSKSQRNFTDPESRIMKSKDGFVQAYNARPPSTQAPRIIVRARLSSAAAIQGQLVP